MTGVFNSTKRPNAVQPYKAPSPCPAKSFSSTARPHPSPPPPAATGLSFPSARCRLRLSTKTAVAMDNEAYRQTFTDTGDGSNGQYGNMSCTPAGPGCVAFTYNVAKNQISNAGYSYGARGNLTGDGTY